MKYQKIKYVTKPLSKIIFGCAIPSMIQGEDADELLDEVYAQGITTFDTAENYGLSEEALWGIDRSKTVETEKKS